MPEVDYELMAKLILIIGDISQFTLWKQLAKISLNSDVCEIMTIFSGGVKMREFFRLIIFIAVCVF